MVGNPYHGIFVLDERIANAETMEEIYELRNKVKVNKKYSLDTKQTLYLWMIQRGDELKNELIEKSKPYGIRLLGTSKEDET